MILQALKEYYDRRAADPASGIAPDGFEQKEIPFVLVLDEGGHPVSLNETTEGQGKARRAKVFLVPQGEKRTVGIRANLLWDNPEYVLGIVLKGKNDRVAEQHAAFIARLESLAGVADAGMMAILKFYADPNNVKQVEAFGETWKALVESGGNITFQIAGQKTIVAESPAIRAAIANKSPDKYGHKDVCLVSGTDDEIELLHASIKGVWGAQSSGANIVSFNQPSFRSWGKEQGANSPVGQSTAFAYTTALNHLLGKGSRQRMQVGDASTVFWSARESKFEAEVADFFCEPPKDDPDRNVRAVDGLFRSVQTGALAKEEGANTFYVLGLSPNASRIAIRFWMVDSIPNMAARFCQHFEDIKIIHGPRDPATLSLFRLLVATASLGKSDNIPPNIAGDTMRAILEGRPYPQSLLQAAIRRIRADHELTYPRAALIKACINRANRLKNPPNKEELKVTLDLNNANIGYRLGRLFASLEKLQSEAHPGLNATIRDKFYGAASSTPVTVFGNLMRLKNHHLAKLENGGRRVNFERLLAEIVNGIDNFPSHLNLEDQGRFAIGYYHQMQDFYTKKTENNQVKGE